MSSRSRKALVVGLLLVVALGVRLAEVQRTAYRPVSDGASYLTLASEIAHAGDYSSRSAPGSGAGGSRGPTAYFPPAYPYFLTAVDLIAGHTGPRGGAVRAARISQAVIGTGIVALAALVAFEAFGELVALIALALAAIYPVLIELSGTIAAENLMTLLVLAAVWAALRSRRSGHPYRWTALAGALTGLAILTHMNSVVLLVPLAVAAWNSLPARARQDHPPSDGVPARHRAAAVALLVVMTALVVLPWTIRNAVELHRFLPVADETGFTLVGTYNAGSAANPRLPYKWRFFGRIPGEPPALLHPTGLTEPDLSSRLQSQAFHYIGAHPLAPLEALYHNTRRMLELAGSYAWQDSASSIGLADATARVGVFSFWLLCLLALAGLFTRAVRRGPWWLWLAPLLLWISAALVNGETPRFREPIDPFLIALGACALAPLLRAAGRRLTAPARRHRGTAMTGRSRELVEMRERLA